MIYWSKESEDLYWSDLNGINALITASDNVKGMPWFWLVEPSGRRSECPETYDAGWGRTLRSAQRKAEAAMAKADKSYQTAGPEGW